MTNETMLNVLNTLCNEARNSAHATFGLLELHREAAETAWRECLELSRTSADRLLRAMDDYRELLSSAPAAPEVMDGFDLTLSVAAIIELLNLAGREKTARVRLEALERPLLVRHAQQALEQVFTRILDAASKLTQSGEIHVALKGDAAGDGIQLTIRPSNSNVAVLLADWLNADPELIRFQDEDEVSFGVAVMVAGKRLRELGGAAELVSKDGKPTHIVIHLHSQTDANNGHESLSGEYKAQPDTLNILLTEDCDDSYALAKLLLWKENVWRARTGPEAIEIVRKQRFDVVFMDVHMPGIDGYSTIRAIRDWETQTGNARTPIVVLSSDDLETQRRSAAQSGCCAFLRKPLRNGELLALLGRLKAT